MSLVSVLMEGPKELGYTRDKWPDRRNADMEVLG